MTYNIIYDIINFLNFRILISGNLESNNTPNTPSFNIKEQLNEIFDRTLASVPMESFEDTDLVVFSGKKFVPFLNGIRVGEFREILHILSQIKNDESPIRIKGSEKFKQQVLECIKKLLTRAVGRTLFKDLIAKLDENCLTIQETDEGTQYLPRERVVLLNTKKFYAIGLSSTGERIPIDAPLFIDLAHELSHAQLDFSEYQMSIILPPTVDRKFDNLEEQRAISGHLKPIVFSEEVQKDLTDDDLQMEFDSIEPKREEFEENHFRSAFNLPARISHEGFSRPDSIKLKQDETRKQTTSYFLAICRYGLNSLIEEFITVNKGVDMRSLLDEALLEAAESDYVHTVEKLVKLGASWNLKDEESWHQLSKTLLKTGSFKTLRWLFEKGLIRNFAKSSSAHPSLLYQVCFFSQMEVIKKEESDFCEFLLKEFDPNESYEGVTLLHRALNNEKYELVLLLLETGLKLSPSDFQRIISNFPLKWIIKVLEVLNKNGQALDSSYIDPDTGDTLLHSLMKNQEIAGKIFFMAPDEIEKFFMEIGNIVEKFRMYDKELINKINKEGKTFLQCSLCRISDFKSDKLKRQLGIPNASV